MGVYDLKSVKLPKLTCSSQSPDRASLSDTVDHRPQPEGQNR
jgi:hypothetical protein